MLKRWMFAGLLAIGTALPAAAQVPPVEGDWTRLVNAEWSELKGPTGGQCLDVPWSSKEIGDVVQMWRCHDGANQLVRRLDAGVDSRIAVYSGVDLRCIAFDPQSGKITITSCSNAPRWRATDAGAIATSDGYYCIRVPDDGRPELASCDPDDPQDPRMVFGSNWTMDTLEAPFGRNDFVLVDEMFDHCLDVRGGSTSPGSSLFHYGCHFGGNQSVRVRGTKNRVFLLVYRDGRTLCISNVLDRGNPASSQGVPCNRNDERLAWGVEGGDPAKGESFRLRNAATGRCLDAFARSRDLGTWPCHGGANQEWWLLVP